MLGWGFEEMDESWTHTTDMVAVNRSQGLPTYWSGDAHEPKLWLDRFFDHALPFFGLDLF